jgi:hypothetical protein
MLPGRRVPCLLGLMTNAGFGAWKCFYAARQTDDSLALGAQVEFLPFTWFTPCLEIRRITIQGVDAYLERVGGKLNTVICLSLSSIVPQHHSTFPFRIKSPTLCFASCSGRNFFPKSDLSHRQSAVALKNGEDPVGGVIVVWSDNSEETDSSEDDAVRQSLTLHPTPYTLHPTPYTAHCDEAY